MRSSSSLGAQRKRRARNGRKVRGKAPHALRAHPARSRGCRGVRQRYVPRRVECHAAAAPARALFAFLARICRNIACDKLDRLRAKKRSAEVSALTEELSACIADPTAAREAESREIAEALNCFLSTLPRRCPALFHAPLLVYGFRKSHRRKVRLRRKPRQNVSPPHA